MSYLLDD